MRLVEVRASWPDTHVNKKKYNKQKQNILEACIDIIFNDIFSIRLSFKIQQVSPLNQAKLRLKENTNKPCKHKKIILQFFSVHFYCKSALYIYIYIYKSC